MDQFLSELRNWVWGAPLLLLLLGTGAYLTILLKGVQFRYLGYAFKQVVARQRQGSQGDISHFQALMTSLAGAIGTGTIVGVATAITVGGLGAIFWMWVTAFLSMATKYAESLLAVRYREKDSRGEMAGGPMQYMEKGLGWNRMAWIFAVLGMVAALSTGNLVQTNSIAEALNHVWHVDSWLTGVILCALTAVVVIGGVKSIGNVASILVPGMALLYIGAAIYILIVNFTHIPEAFMLIFHSAWNGQAATGGFLGSTMMMAMQMGVARSVFSNEAGLGISSVAAAAAKTDSPGRQALVTMTGALISTVIVCTMTGLVLAVTNVMGATGANGQVLNGASMAIAAFNTHIIWGEYLVTIGLVLFAYTTVLAWSYYGEKCCEYLFGERSIIAYRILFALVVIPGAALKMETAWYLADISNGLMVIPNLIALVGLSSVIRKETEEFLVIANREETESAKLRCVGDE
ncbi:Alanine or Glycine Cation Symporter (AGCS) family protein [Candidatus Protochlamydia naegleriophila]|uniref:Alanine or Glycine Cation Symporter (AGCS) family protein n=2 Tax=Candidatus Protochlamydia naegleriophila TaxID=389348 RepID=A0A0U5ESP9_9BACT|nr:sodium:alanine symporter family protein [Candidatus Protochlamydia naegleriophila]CUI17248.1 Alanine or Glycine Cation Symporter (AGCS) family protein [Candidatus Protochlamydia naegleriophila]